MYWVITGKGKFLVYRLDDSGRIYALAKDEKGVVRKLLVSHEDKNAFDFGLRAFNPDWKGKAPEDWENQKVFMSCSFTCSEEDF